ncbi:hypothetical protein KFL01_02550 [Kocuria flava]|uniref:HTH tetR-type domain-containing protein n=1 Tax=Kocuria flava TaxID=446860 RepID=A0ABQ0X5N8_9MICC|nr:hypothetical protein KFL01_02550 [Kocuria flava]
MLDAAAAQFRVHGFADTSTEQLCAAAGVRRSSLYNAFDSKDELFVRALERYVEVTGESQEAVLADAELDGFARVSGVLDLMIAEEHEASTGGHAAGCMVVTTRMTPDRGNQDPRIARILDRALGRQLAMLEHAVRAGKLDGSLRPDLDPRDTALLVVTLISGIRVMAQAGSAPEELRRIVTLGLSALTP